MLRFFDQEIATPDNFIVTLELVSQQPPAEPAIFWAQII